MYVSWDHIREPEAAAKMAKDWNIHWPNRAKALTICWINNLSDGGQYGWAVCGKKDQFSRPRARLISFGRACRNLTPEEKEEAKRVAKEGNRGRNGNREADGAGVDPARDERLRNHSTRSHAERRNDPSPAGPRGDGGVTGRGDEEAK